MTNIEHPHFIANKSIAQTKCVDYLHGYAFINPYIESTNKNGFAIR